MTTFYPENVDDYSSKYNDPSRISEDSGLEKSLPPNVNLHNIDDTRKRYYSYKGAGLGPLKYSDDSILDQRKKMDKNLVRKLFQQEIFNRMKSSGFYRGIKDDYLHTYSVLMLYLRDKIIEKLITKGVIQQEYEAYPYNRTTDGADQYMFYIVCDYMDNCSNLIGRRSAEVNAMNEAKDELGGIYTKLHILPSFPFGMPAQNTTYTDKNYIETGSCEIIKETVLCHYSEYNMKYFPSIKRIEDIEEELPLIDAEYIKLQLTRQMYECERPL